MIQSYARRFAHEFLFDPLAARVARTRVAPNVISTTAVLASVVACLLIAGEHYLSAAFAAALSGVLDIVDGCVARAANRTSAFGAYWDAIADRYADCFILLGFVPHGYALETFLATTGTLLTSYAKPRTAVDDQLYSKDWPTVGERAERLLLICVGLAAAAYVADIAGVDTLRLTLWAVAGITHIGAVQRIFFTRRLMLNRPEATQDSEEPT